MSLIKPDLHELKTTGIVITLWCLFIAYIKISNDSYKQGQIDALTGKIQYRLEKQPDGSTEWKEIKK